ncbi:Uu.00g002770.m01.CDS01 [Anthostomella pinea]|uniref:Uu.00g002770.m01.CDS01 n=1 Tax=Anthostomella pinea TaxID=933095 RepID=A0AAI8VKC7_9PEZI|nr:Uu.00g002770.m01.CDS01 [Anthostomella pinea]
MPYSRAPSFYSSNPTCHKWDPETVLGLINPCRGFITCVGTAPSMGRRCRNKPAAATIGCGQSILNKLARQDASKAALSPDLEKAAEHMLCYLHGLRARNARGNQASHIAKDWQSDLEDWAADNETVSSCDSDNDSNSGGGSDHGSHGATAPSRFPLSFNAGANFKKEAEDDCSNDELKAMMKQMQDNLARLQAEMKRRDTHTAQPTSTQAQEQRQDRIEQEEQIRRCREDEERKRREQARCEEEVRKRTQERQRKEREERERAFQEKVRIAQEKREREAREQAQKEQAEWRTAWDRYTSAWDDWEVAYR